MRRFIISAVMLFSVAFGSFAQEMPAIPVDPAVRVGRLENGLTYYIRHNEEPKGQANFYIAQKVGSILEDENQRGLAHFLEHMCFNGTKNFPGNGVIKYCESIGVQFGGDLNAYTSVDETVYNIDNVPVATVPSAVDSCLWILHDWADGLLLEGDDIDHERGVIHEEWRQRMNAQMRMYEKILPALYPDGNRYGERLPIGTMEVVDNFPYQAIRDYYEKWYRPDQQGIVVVGDINVDEIEAKIKSIFGTIATPVNPAERFYVQIPDNKEPIFAMAKDKEQPYAMTYIFLKHDAFPTAMKGSLNYLVYDFAVSMADAMLSQRLLELSQLPEPPFVQGSAGSDQDYFLAKTKKSFMGVVVSNPEDLTKATTTMYREMLRALRNGFTASEYERAKAEYMTQLESRYNQREKVKSASFCSQYVRHFIDNEPIPGIENMFALAQQLVPSIPVEVINQLIAQFNVEGNLAVACMLPDKEGISYPSEAELASAFAAVAAETIAPYEDKVSDEPLMAQLPKAGKVKKSKDAKFGYKQLTLSNGVTVYIRKTDFNADQIILRAFSKGGLSLYPASWSVDLKSVSDFFNGGGVGNFSVTELNKVLAGKKVSVNPYITSFEEGINGSTTPKDMETMFQLTNLYFTDLRADNDAFVSNRNKLSAMLKNAEAQPTTALQDSLYNTIYKTRTLVGNIKSSDVESINYDRIMQIARERFANAADFTFVITGNFDEAVLIPMLEQYIASLPANGKKEKYNPSAIEFTTGNHVNIFDKKMEVPSTIVAYVNSGKAVFNLKNSLSFNIANQVLTTILLEEIREKEGGTYGINAVGDISYTPRQEAVMQIVYQTNPEKYEYLNGKIEDIVAKFAVEGPTAEQLQKVKDYLIKNHQESLRENYFWANQLYNYLVSGVDITTDYESVLNSITPADVCKSVNDILSQGNRSLVVMNGVQ